MQKELPAVHRVMLVLATRKHKLLLLQTLVPLQQVVNLPDGTTEPILWYRQAEKGAWQMLKPKDQEALRHKLKLDLSLTNLPVENR